MSKWLKTALMSALIPAVGFGVHSPVSAQSVARKKAPRPDTTRVECYGRKAGDYAQGDGGKLGKTVISLKKGLKTTEKKSLDVHYADMHTFKLVALTDVLAACRTKKKHASKSGNLIVLHFENGMVVPFPNDPAALKKLDAQIAVDVRGADGSWAGKFPAAERDDTVTMDAGAMVFGQNKLVVQNAWFPAPDGKSALFSPWRHTDSLVGIEFADKAAYDAQFRIPDKKSKAVAWGEKVFLRNCQYCHSVGDVGSTYGWDFLLPQPLHEHKRSKALYEHVTVREYNAAEKGIKMPTQPLEKRDIAGIEAWSKARYKLHQARTPLPYVPPKK